MAWWVWTFVVWIALALLLGIVLGRFIRIGERREVGRDRALEQEEDEEPWAS